MAHTFNITKILAPTDLSPSGIPALRYARYFAECFKAQLTVLYSVPIIYPVDVIAPSMFVSPEPTHEAQLREDIAHYAGPVMGQQPYDIRVTVGQPIPAILEAAKEHGADLIIVGTHLESDLRRVILGSVSDGVLFESRCPVLTVIGDEHPASTRVQSLGTILCPINFTDVARASLHVAARLAEVTGAELLVVHVVEHDQTTDPKEDERRVRGWIGNELAGKCSYRELVLRGSAAERVLDCAEDAGASLIVVGAQHKFFRNGTVIGSTADRLIRFASCPVFVVPRQALAGERHESVAEPAMAEW